MNLPPGRRAGVFVCLSGGADIYASPINANNRPTLYIDGHEIRRVRRKIDHRAGRKGEGRGSGVGSSEERVDECHPVGAAWAVHAARFPRPQTDPQVGDGGGISEAVHVELHAGQTVARPLRADLKPLGTGERTSLSERRRPLPQVAHQGGSLRRGGQRHEQQTEQYPARPHPPQVLTDGRQCAGKLRFPSPVPSRPRAAGPEIYHSFSSALFLVHAVCFPAGFHCHTTFRRPCPYQN